MAINKRQVIKTFRDLGKKGELGPVDRATILLSLEIEGSVPDWLQAEVVEAHNKLSSRIQIQEFLHQRDGKAINIAGEYKALTLLKQKFPLADKWAENLRESRRRKE